LLFTACRTPHALRHPCIAAHRRPLDCTQGALGDPHGQDIDEHLEEHPGTGRAFTTNGAVPNLQQHGFNDRASSVVILGSPWEVCENAEFGANAGRIG
jgi:hypothetical protein